MTESKIIVLLTVSLLTASGFLAGQNIVFARGGGFHSSGFGGHFGGDFGDRGFANRGFGDRAFDDVGFGRGRLDSDRPTAFSRPYGDVGLGRTSEADLRAGADREWNGGIAGQRALATDGGFGRMLSSADMRGFSNLGHYTTPISSAALASRGNAVRDAYRRNDLFNHAWWARHADAWYDAAWGNAWAWGYTGWPALAGFWGLPAVDEPIDYDYGNNITYQNNTVYYGSQPAATADEYYTQSQALAQSSPDAAQGTTQPPPGQTQNWKPLGIFSLTQGGQTDSTVMFQLAVDKAGAIAGNYYNVLTDEVKPVKGAVDKKNMRAAWIVGSNKDVVYETGMSNLLKAQSTALIHFGKDKTDEWTLVRLKQAKGA